MQLKAPKGRQETPTLVFLSSLRDLELTGQFDPWARAHGYILSPLRGLKVQFLLRIFTDDRDLICCIPLFAAIRSHRPRQRQRFLGWDGISGCIGHDGSGPHRSTPFRLAKPEFVGNSERNSILDRLPGVPSVQRDVQMAYLTRISLKRWADSFP